MSHETEFMVRALVNHCVTNCNLSDGDWCAFKDQHRMTPADTEAVLLSTLRHILVLAGEQQREMERLTIALARRG